MPVVRFKYHHTSLKLFIKITVNTTILVNIIIIMFVATWQAELCGLPAQPLLRLWLAQLVLRPWCAGSGAVRAAGSSAQAGGGGQKEEEGPFPPLQAAGSWSPCLAVSESAGLRRRLRPNLCLPKKSDPTAAFCSLVWYKGCPNREGGEGWALSPSAGSLSFLAFLFLIGAQIKS